MYQVRLTEQQRLELKQRAHDPAVKPRTRDRLEMVRLSDAGFSIPQIAKHLEISEVRVRFWIKGFLAGGFAALPDQPHVGQKSSVTPALIEALRTELAKGDRTWTAAQLCVWLKETQGVSLTPDWLGRLLKRADLSYKRTYRSLHHKQNKEEVAAKREELEARERGPHPEGETSVTSMRPVSP